MKKSRIIFVTLLASLGLAGVSTSNLPFVQDLDFGVIAKADTVTPIFQNQNGDSTPLSSSIPGVDSQIQFSNFLSSNGDTSVNARRNNNKDWAITYLPKDVTNLTWNIPITNNSKRDVYIRDFTWLPNTTDGLQSPNGPIFKMGTSASSSFQDVFSPAKLGLTSDNWIPETGQTTGIAYRPATGGYNWVNDSSTPNLSDVTGFGLYGKIKAGTTIDIKIPLYLANPNSVQSGVLNNFYNVLYNYKDGYTQVPADFDAIGSYLHVGTLYTNTGGTATTPSETTSSSSSSSTTTSSSSSASQSSSTPTTPTTKPTVPTTNPGSGIAVKGEAVYATKKIGLYKGTKFTKANRVAWYPKQKRINRPMFVVTSYKRTSNGALRYKVRDVNHGRKTAGKTGYITASRKFVVPVYYASVPKAKKITVISPKGVNAYKSVNLTGKAKHYKKGVRITVKKLVKHNLTTRYQLSNGNYVTANKKLIIAGNY